MTGKNVLIVFAHPTRESFNGKIVQAAVESLTASGHAVTVSDLYQAGFNPTLRKADLEGHGSPDMSKSRDVLEEQKKLDAADLVIFQFPLYCLGFPAILKGYFERVMEKDYAFQLPNNIFDLARFKGKRAMLSFTTGSTEAAYSNKGLLGDINVILWPLQNGALRYNGFDVLAPNIVFGFDVSVDGASVLLQWRQRLEKIFEERPLFFHKIDEFEDSKLKDDIVEKIKGPYSRTVGQNCGLRLPPVPQTEVVYREQTDKVNAC